MHAIGGGESPPPADADAICRADLARLGAEIETPQGFVPGPGCSVANPVLLNEGLKIFTTMDSERQCAAQESILQGLLTVDKRQGFRGVLLQLKKPEERAAFVEHGRRAPDPNPKLEACYRAAIATVRDHEKLGRNRLAIGGKSTGGRIASQVVAAGADDMAALAFLGYPLHPPGRPDQLRAKHLTDIAAPMLFVQGSRDAFGTPAELRPILAKLEAPAELHVVEGGDHSFKVPKRAGISQDAVYEVILDRIERWLRETLAGR